MIYMTSILTQTSARHPQIWSRHCRRPTDTIRHSPDRQRHFYLLEGTGRNGNIWVGITFIHFYQQICYEYISRHHHTSPRHSQTESPRHRHCYAIQGTERKCNIWVSWPNIFFANRFGTDASQDTLRHHLDIIQTPSDTIQTPPDIDVFAIEGTGRKGNIRVWPNLNFANGFGIAISWYHDILVLIHSQTLSDPIQTPSRHPQTPSRHPQTKAFLC